MASSRAKSEHSRQSLFLEPARCHLAGNYHVFTHTLLRTLATVTSRVNRERDHDRYRPRFGCLASSLRAWHTHLGRRLWHRLLVASVSETLTHRRTQD